MALKSKLSRLLVAGNFAALIPLPGGFCKVKSRMGAFHHTPFSVDELQFGEAQKIAGVIDAFCRALFGNYVILT